MTPQTATRQPATGTTPKTTTTDQPVTPTTVGKDSTPTTATQPTSTTPQTTSTSPAGDWGVSGSGPAPGTTGRATTPGSTPQTTTKDGTPTTSTQPTSTTPQTTSTSPTGDWGVSGSGPTPATGGLATSPGSTPQTTTKDGTPTTSTQPTSTTPQTTSTSPTGDWGVSGSGPVPATGGLATSPGSTPQTASKDGTPTTQGQPTTHTPQTTGGSNTPGAWGVAGTGPVAATGERAGQPGGPGQTVAKGGGSTPGTTENAGGGSPSTTTTMDGDGSWGMTGSGATGGTREKPAPGSGQTVAKDPAPADAPAPKPGDRNAGGGHTFSKGTTQADLDQANRPPTEDELKAAKPGDGPDEYATREKKIRDQMAMRRINEESAPPIVARTSGTPTTREKPKPFVPTTQEDKDRLNYINTKLNDAITKAKSATDLETKAKYTKLAKFWLGVRDHYGSLTRDFKDDLDDLQKTEGTWMYPEHEMLLQKYADEGATAVTKYRQDSAEMEFYKGVGAIVDMGGNLGLGATFSAIESELAAISNEAQTGRSSRTSRATAEEEPTPAQHVEDDSNLPDFEKAPVDEEGGWGTRQPWDYEDDSPPILTDPKTGEAVPARIDPKTGDIVPVNPGPGAPATASGPRTVSPDAPTVSVSGTPTEVGPQFDASKTQPDLLPHDKMPAKGMQRTAYEDFNKVPVDPSGKPGTRLPYSQGRFDPTDVPIDPQTGLPIPEK